MPMIAAAEPDLPRCFGLDVDPARLRLPGDARRFVATALGHYRPEWATLAPYLRFSPHSYTRNLLYRDERIEMLLLCWLPGQKTPVHDHGASWGVAAAINGDLLETSYRVTREGDPLELVDMRRMHPGTVAFETKETIHQIENASSSPIVSLHVYGPPLAHFATYDPLTGERVLVKTSLTGAR